MHIQPNELTSSGRMCLMKIPLELVSFKLFHVLKYQNDYFKFGLNFKLGNVIRYLLICETIFHRQNCNKNVHWVHTLHEACMSTLWENKTNIEGAGRSQLHIFSTSASNQNAQLNI